MIPYAYVSGTFYTATGAVRANEEITFMPLSTPYSASGGEIVLSIPQVTRLNASGQLFTGANLYYKLAKGYYRVIASDTDAFFISVPDDGLVHTIDSIATGVEGLPSGLQLQVLQSKDVYGATSDSYSVTRSLEGEAFKTPIHFMFVGESGSLAGDSIFPELGESIGIHEMFVLGNANPNGTAGTLAFNLQIPWGSWISNSDQHFWYAMGDQDWIPGNVNAVTNYLTTPGLRYFKVRISDVGVFVIDSNNLEPDGNTISSVQGTWLRDQLAASTERWRIVVFRDTPFVSVVGKSKAAMDWPFAAWGAHAVIAAGAKVMEHIVLAGDIPLFVVGCTGTGAKDTFGTPLGNSVYRATNRRAVLDVVVTQKTLTFHMVDMLDASIFHSYTKHGPENLSLRFNVNFMWDSGFAVNRTDPSFQLEPYGLANFMVREATDYMRQMTPGVGNVVRMAAAPDAAMAAQQPWLKNCIVVVGDDPVKLWVWNSAAGAFVGCKTEPYSGVSYYGGARTQLVPPYFTPASGAAMGVTIFHATAGIEMWISENGDPFAIMSGWFSGMKYLFHSPPMDRPIMLSAFVRKAGFLDSDIWSKVYMIPTS